MAENEMIRQHVILNGHEFEQILGDSGRQGSLACCSAWGCRVGHDSVAVPACPSVSHNRWLVEEMIGQLFNETVSDCFSSFAM